MKLDYFLIFTTLLILICLYHLSRKEKYENISFTLKSRPGIKDLTVGELKLNVPDGVVLVPRNGSAGMMQVKNPAAMMQVKNPAAMMQVQEPAAMVEPAMDGVSKAGVPQTGTAQDQVNAIMAQLGDEPITPETILNMTKPFDGEADVPEKEMVEVPVGQDRTQFLGGYNPATSYPRHNKSNDNYYNFCMGGAAAGSCSEAAFKKACRPSIVHENKLMRRMLG